MKQFSQNYFENYKTFHKEFAQHWWILEVQCEMKKANDRGLCAVAAHLDKTLNQAKLNNLLFGHPIYVIKLLRKKGNDEHKFSVAITSSHEDRVS